VNCCNKQRIQALSHKRAVIGDDGHYQDLPHVNKICLSCGSHWYGLPDDVKFYTRKEWDAWIESA
jgi:hypothetical protein